MPRSRRSLLAAALALPVAALAASAPAIAGGRDKDCNDFSSQKKAQRFFKRHGGPRKDPHGLDSDNDGKACEELR